MTSSPILLYQPFTTTVLLSPVDHSPTSIWPSWDVGPQRTSQIHAWFPSRASSLDLVQCTYQEGTYPADLHLPLEWGSSELLHLIYDGSNLGTPHWPNPAATRRSQQVSHTNKTTPTQEQALMQSLPEPQDPWAGRCWSNKTQMSSWH
jgi:hypothetical protein